MMTIAAIETMIMKITSSNDVKNRAKKDENCVKDYGECTVSLVIEFLDRVMRHCFAA